MFFVIWEHWKSHICAELQNHFTNCIATDVILKAGSDECKVHTFILCMFSDYLRKIINSAITETECELPIIITFSEFSYESIHCITSFMYAGEVSVAEYNLEEVVALSKLLGVKGLEDLGAHVDESLGNSIQINSFMGLPDEQFIEDLINNKKIRAELIRVPKSLDNIDFGFDETESSDEEPKHRRSKTKSCQSRGKAGKSSNTLGSNCNTKRSDVSVPEMNASCMKYKFRKEVRKYLDQIDNKKVVEDWPLKRLGVNILRTVRANGDEFGKKYFPSKNGIRFQREMSYFWYRLLALSKKKIDDMIVCISENSIGAVCSSLMQERPLIRTMNVHNLDNMQICAVILMLTICDKLSVDIAVSAFSISAANELSRLRLKAALCLYETTGLTIMNIAKISWLAYKVLRNQILRKHIRKDGKFLPFSSFFSKAFRLCADGTFDQEAMVEEHPNVKDYLQEFESILDYQTERLNTFPLPKYFIRLENALDAINEGRFSIAEAAKIYMVSQAELVQRNILYTYKPKLFPQKRPLDDSHSEEVLSPLKKTKLQTSIPKAMVKGDGEENNNKENALSACDFVSEFVMSEVVCNEVSEVLDDEAVDISSNDGINNEEMSLDDDVDLFESSNDAIDSFEAPRGVKDSFDDDVNDSVNTPISINDVDPDSEVYESASYMHMADCKRDMDDIKRKLEVINDLVASIKKNKRNKHNYNTQNSIDNQAEKSVNGTPQQVRSIQWRVYGQKSKTRKMKMLHQTSSKPDTENTESLNQDSSKLETENTLLHQIETENIELLHQNFSNPETEKTDRLHQNSSKPKTRETKMLHQTPSKPETENTVSLNQDSSKLETENTLLHQIETENIELLHQNFSNPEAEKTDRLHQNSSKPKTRKTKMLHRTSSKPETENTESLNQNSSKLETVFHKDLKLKDLRIILKDIVKEGGMGLSSENKTAQNSLDVERNSLPNEYLDQKTGLNLDSMIDQYCLSNETTEWDLRIRDAIKRANNATTFAKIILSHKITSQCGKRIVKYNLDRVGAPVNKTLKERFKMAVEFVRRHGVSELSASDRCIVHPKHLRGILNCIEKNNRFKPKNVLKPESERTENLRNSKK